MYPMIRIWNIKDKGTRRTEVDAKIILIVPYIDVENWKLRVHSTWPAPERTFLSHDGTGLVTTLAIPVAHGIEYFNYDNFNINLFEIDILQNRWLWTLHVKGEQVDMRRIRKQIKKHILTVNQQPTVDLTIGYPKLTTPCNTRPTSYNNPWNSSILTQCGRVAQTRSWDLVSRKIMNLGQK